MRGADRAQEVGGLGVLEQEAGRAGPEHAGEQLVVVERRQREHRRRVRLRRQAPGRLDAVDVAHPQVHDDHVRLQLGHGGREEPTRAGQLGPQAGEELGLGRHRVRSSSCQRSVNVRETMEGRSRVRVH